MALTRTTLASAYTVGDIEINVVSATGIVAGRQMRIDDEWFIVQSNYSAGTKIPVRGGQNGSKGKNHVAGSGVAIWPNPITNSGEYTAPGPMATAPNMIAG